MKPLKTMTQQAVYFPNLNGLRCIAAILVIVHHIEQIKFIYHIDSYWHKSPFIDIIGRLGVVLFFVLSGFLITYLLLAAEQSTQKIGIKRFYIRRALRIWPLYFLIVILALFVLPHFSFFTLPGYGQEIVWHNLALKIGLYATFFANLVLSAIGIVPYAAQTWSIGTEEQFYIVWPLLLALVKKHRCLLMVSVVLLYIVVYGALNSPRLDFIPYQTLMADFWGTFSIDCMAIGGLFALMLFQKWKILRFIQNTYLFYITLALTIALIISGYKFVAYTNGCYSVLFGIIILNFATNQQQQLSLENAVFNYLGKISYGLYMFHPILIVISIKIGLSVGILSNYFLYPISLLLTVLLAGFSYTYFESKFLAYKHQFTDIISGENAIGSK
jgi:peptidoglycan/LPS O-acetylase OafA/YrhL